jgi:MOSC domain-containing protein YiiM
VKSVSRTDRHTFRKEACETIELLSGLGVKEDAHCGKTVKHRSRVAADPTQPNLRQVHLIHAELFEELRDQGFAIGAGDLGENILTEGINLLGLPRDTLLSIGDTTVVRVTGLRNPCAQIDSFQDGLLRAVLGRDEGGNPIRKSGIMGVVVTGGAISAGDQIKVELPPKPHRRLRVV